MPVTSAVASVSGPDRFHRVMMRQLVVFTSLVALLASTARAQKAETRPTPRAITPPRPAYVRKPGDFVVICTLYNGPPPGAKLKSPPVPVTYDPRFVIGARVEDVVEGKSPWKKGATLQFLIHSPSLMFGGSGFSGHRFSLTFSLFVPTTKDDLVWFQPETRQLLRWIEPVIEEIR